MLPYLKDRPLTMHRFPDGIRGDGFYQKEIGDYFPDWIKRATEKKVGGTTTYLICNDAATLVYIANQACIDAHVWLSREDKPENPDMLVFDLDPPGHDFEPVREAVFAFKEFFAKSGISVFVKTTGSKGIHIVLPLDSSSVFDEVRAFAQNVAKFLANENPGRFTVEVRKEKRGNRVFLDTARNSYAQTAVAPYSVRAIPGAPVATPLDWEEMKEPKLTAQRYNIKNVFAMLSKKRDPWQNLWQKSYSISEMRQRLGL